MIRLALPTLYTVVPTTREDWGLKEATPEAVVDSLSSALRKACVLLFDDKGTTAEAVYLEIVRPVQDRHAFHGARDPGVVDMPLELLKRIEGVRTLLLQDPRATQIPVKNEAKIHDGG